VLKSRGRVKLEWRSRDSAVRRVGKRLSRSHLGALGLCLCLYWLRRMLEDYLDHVVDDYAKSYLLHRGSFGVAPGSHPCRCY
jgi:hypothetical protein